LTTERRFLLPYSDKLKSEHSLQNEEYKDLITKKLREDKKKKNKTAKATNGEGATEEK
jgi:hypothetical protein